MARHKSAHSTQNASGVILDGQQYAIVSVYAVCFVWKSQDRELRQNISCLAFPVDNVKRAMSVLLQMQFWRIDVTSWSPEFQLKQSEQEKSSGAFLCPPREADGRLWGFGTEMTPDR